MPPLRRAWRIVRIATLPETRRFVAATARSTRLRAIAVRARTDRAGLIRDATNPANARRLAGDAVRHPAAAELANAGFLLLPLRYTPLAWAATWAARRVLRRHVPSPEPNGPPKG